MYAKRLMIVTYNMKIAKLDQDGNWNLENRLKSTTSRLDTNSVLFFNSTSKELRVTASFFNEINYKSASRFATYL